MATSGPPPFALLLLEAGSHCGLGFNPLVLYAVADRLSQPEGRWKPFDYSGWRTLLYR
jgi:hypothetical protein